MSNNSGISVSKSIKRSADTQLTKDSVSEDSDNNSNNDNDNKDNSMISNDGFAIASQETLNKRVFVSVKRKGENEGKTNITSITNNNNITSYKPPGPVSFSFATTTKTDNKNNNNKNNNNNEISTSTNTINNNDNKDGNSTVTVTGIDTSSSSSSLSNNDVWARFKAPEGSWECPMCKNSYNVLLQITTGALMNKPTAMKCIACEEPNPKSNAINNATDKNQSATTEINNNSSSITESGFSFGGILPTQNIAPTSAGITTTTGGTYTFGLADSSPNTGFGFTFDNSSSNSSGGFASFLNNNNNNNNNESEGKNEFHFENGEENAEFQPNADLKLANANELFKDSKQENSGEENDTVLLKQRAKLYVLKTKSKTNTENNNTRENNNSDNSNNNNENNNKEESNSQWSELGVGELHINTYKSNSESLSKARFVLRAEKTQRLVLNSPIYTKMIFSIQNNNFIRFQSFDLELKPAVFLLKFKAKSEAEITYNAIQDVIKQLKD